MDDSDKPTLETEGIESRDDGWTMPEPVFRSTPGKALRAAAHDPEKDIPTESADKPESRPSVRQKEDALGTRHKKKKRGCARVFTGIALLVGLLVGSAIVALIYFLFYYRPSSTTF